MRIWVDYHTTAAVLSNTDILAGGFVLIKAHSATDSQANAWASGLGFGATVARGRPEIGLHESRRDEAEEGANAGIVVDTFISRHSSRACARAAAAPAHERRPRRRSQQQAHADRARTAPASTARASTTPPSRSTRTPRSDPRERDRHRLRGRRLPDALLADMPTYADSFARSTGLFGYVDADATNNTDLDCAGARRSRRAHHGRPARPGRPEPRSDPPTPASARAAARLAFFVDMDNDSIVTESNATARRPREQALARGRRRRRGRAQRSTARRTSRSARTSSILSGRSPVLEIDSSGTITKAVEVSVYDGARQPDPQSGRSRARRSSSTTSSTRAPATSSSAPTERRASSRHRSPGSGGTWTFCETLPQVRIVNNSSKPLELNNINVVGTDEPLVWLDTSSTVTITFRINADSAPTLVDIRNLSASNVNSTGRSTTRPARRRSSTLAATSPRPRAASTGLHRHSHRDASSATRSSARTSSGSTPTTR